jgi:hypothetical protein
VGEAAAARCRADLESAARIAAEWRELSQRAEQRDCELEGIKGRFSETTRHQVGGAGHGALVLCWDA